ncbi:MAG TPA: hypothetical protein VFV37_10855 [Luteibaculaceae bacterium]|nr:hypothetical protein [Luteibaculaceae bacterium]
MMRYFWAMAFWMWSAALAAQPIDGYALVDNNLYRLPRLQIGILPAAVRYDLGLNLTPEINLRYRSDRSGEIQLRASSSLPFLHPDQAQPFGPLVRCATCAESDFNPFLEIDADYTYYVKKQSKTSSYRYRTSKILSKDEDGSMKWPSYENQAGAKARLWGIRVGAQYSQRDLFILNRNRTLGYTGLDAQVIYAGGSLTQLGRMFRKVEDGSIRGKGFQKMVYADVMYAWSQTASFIPANRLGSNGEILPAIPRYTPYGFRLGYLSNSYGFKSLLSFTLRTEVGFTPSVEDPINGLFGSIKLGIGIGGVKTPVQYVGKRQQKINEQAPRIEGNGKYRNRTPLGRKIYKRKPLKKIPHRFS